MSDMSPEIKAAIERLRELETVYRRTGDLVGTSQPGNADALALILADHARLQAENERLREALGASEREYENLEDSAPTDPFCADCNMGTGPHRKYCAHHMRVNALAASKGTGEA